MIILSTFVIVTQVANAADSFDGKRFFYGDLHVHTGISKDAMSADIGVICDPDKKSRCGAVADLVKNAKDRGLDFISVTDHLNGNLTVESEADFRTVQGTVIAGNDPDNEFVTVPGVELWWKLADGTKLGHRNLHFFGPDKQYLNMTLDSVRFDGTDQVAKNCDAVWDFVEEVSATYGPTLLLPHATANGGILQGDWSCHNQKYAPAVEVYSNHGNSVTSNYDPLTTDDSYEPGTTIQEALETQQFGHRLGFYAATDNHSTMPGDVCATGGMQSYAGGLAIVVQDEALAFTRESLHTALVELNTYATSGPMLPATVSYYADGKLVGSMGDVLSLNRGETLTINVTVPEVLAHTVTEVTLVSSSDSTDAALWSNTAMESSKAGAWTLTIDDPPEVFYPMFQIDGESWYGKEGCDDGGKDSNERVWLTPSWIDWLAFEEGTALNELPDHGKVDDSEIEETGTIEHHRPDEDTDEGPTTQPDVTEDDHDTGCSQIGGVGSLGQTITLCLLMLVSVTRRLTH